MEKSFYSEEHKKEIDEINRIWQNLQNLEDLASKKGIDDIFQDNGAKVLQQIIMLNFDVLPGREGNDAISKSGIEWEMKSVNIDLTSGFSTNHHTNHVIINKYRRVPWSFAIYSGVELKEIYIMSPKQMEPMYLRWEQQLADGTKTHLNNPKIPVKFVRENGIKVYPINPDSPVDPDDIISNKKKEAL